MRSLLIVILGFNTQPRGGGCRSCIRDLKILRSVSTHSRAEAAANDFPAHFRIISVSTHSRAEAAAFFIGGFMNWEMFQHTAARRRLPVLGGLAQNKMNVSTHSRAEAAAKSVTTPFWF